MKDFESVFSIGKQIIFTGLEVKEGFRKSIVTKGYDITNEQFVILVSLWKEDGQSQIDLCKKTDKSKPSVTRILDTMEKKELITRVADKKDRRKFRIFLTEKGKSMQTPLMENSFEYGTKILSGLNENELSELQRLLSHLRENI